MRTMPTKDAMHILADNLKRLIAESQLYNTPGSVARRADVAVNTVKNMLNCKGQPTLGNIESVASVFGLSAWEILHPDPDRARREMEMYSKIAADFIHQARVASKAR